MRDVLDRASDAQPGRFLHGFGEGFTYRFLRPGVNGWWVEDAQEPGTEMFLSSGGIRAALSRPRSAAWIGLEPGFLTAYGVVVRRATAPDMLRALEGVRVFYGKRKSAGESVKGGWEAAFRDLEAEVARLRGKDAQ